jgi:hypothetical protein
MECILSNDSTVYPTEPTCKSTCKKEIKSGDKVLMAFSNDNQKTWHYFSSVVGGKDGGTPIVITPAFDTQGLTEKQIKELPPTTDAWSTTILFQDKITSDTKCRSGDGYTGNPCYGTCESAPLTSYFWLGGWNFDSTPYSFLFAPKSSSYATWDEEDSDERVGNQMIWHTESADNSETQYVYNSPYYIHYTMAADWPNPEYQYYMAWYESWTATELNLSKEGEGAKLIVKFFQANSICKPHSPFPSPPSCKKKNDLCTSNSECCSKHCRNEPLLPRICQ